MVEPVNSFTVVTVDQLLLQGGDVALDFVNTVGGLRDDPPDPNDEALNHYADVVHWCRRVELFSARQASSLLRTAEADPRGAASAFDDVLALRRLVYNVFRRLADGSRPRPATLERLRDAEREALAHASFSPAGPRMRWTWRDTDDVRAPFWLIAHAAVELLTHGPLVRPQGARALMAAGSAGERRHARGLRSRWNGAHALHCARRAHRPARLGGRRGVGHRGDVRRSRGRRAARGVHAVPARAGGGAAHAADPRRRLPGPWHGVDGRHLHAGPAQGLAARARRRRRRGGDRRGRAHDRWNAARPY